MRVSVEVDRSKLMQAVTAAEKDGPLSNLQELWVRACAIYNGMQPPKQITHSVVMLRAKEWDFIIQTKPGKKGRAAGVPLSAEQKEAMQQGRKNRGEKFAADPVIQEGFVQLRREVPERFASVVERLTVSGSMSAAVKLKCLDCTAYQTVEIKECTCTSCPLFAFRPYKPGQDDDSEVEAEAA